MLLFLIFAVMASAQRPPQNPLVHAAETDDLATVRRLLDSGADPSQPQNFSALEAASASAFPDVVKAMLARHPDVNQQDSAGRTALNVLGQSAIGLPAENTAEVARLLLAAGAQVNAQDNIFGNTPLHEAPDAAAAQVLIDAGADVNLRNRDGQTALMLALDPEVVRVLLRAGADVTIRDKQGKTVMQLAREFELTEIIAMLEAASKK